MKHMCGYKLLIEFAAFGNLTVPFILFELWEARVFFLWGIWNTTLSPRLGSMLLSKLYRVSQKSAFFSNASLTLQYAGLGYARLDVPRNSPNQFCLFPLGDFSKFTFWTPK